MTDRVIKSTPSEPLNLTRLQDPKANIIRKALPANHDARLEALKLAYEVSFKQERDLDNPKFWTKDTEESTQKNYFRSILQLAEINYKFITEGITEIE